MFKGKTLLITGGTGSFGNALVKQMIDSDINIIRVFSRDEKKQDDMRKLYGSKKLEFWLGDVRDKDSLDRCMAGVDFVFHSAALKQVPSCELHPIEAVATNVIGTENTLTVARAHGVEKVVCLSTDKAVYPINAMGLSKAMMEKLMVAKSRVVSKSNTIFCGTRYGNVMASRGSVIPLFIEQIQSGKPITITNPNMTRFMMSLEDAVALVLYAFKIALNGDIFVQRAPAATIKTLVEAILELVKKPHYPVEIIGTRQGEKLYESLISREELARTEDLGEFLRIRPEGGGLLHDRYVDRGDEQLTQKSEGEEYNSTNTSQLNVKQMKEMLLKLDQFKEICSD